MKRELLTYWHQPKQSKQVSLVGLAECPNAFPVCIQELTKTAQRQGRVEYIRSLLLKAEEPKEAQTVCFQTQPTPPSDLLEHKQQILFRETGENVIFRAVVGTGRILSRRALAGFCFSEWHRLDAWV
jgi:hypothetical protein